MDKKTPLQLLCFVVIPLSCFAAAPFLVAGAVFGDADGKGRQFALDNPGATIEVGHLERNVTEREEIRSSRLIIEGTVVEARPHWKIVHVSTNPRIVTEFTVKVDDVLKGDPGGETVKVVMDGGALDGITYKTDAVNLVPGTRVIMLLANDRNGMFDDSYYPSTATKSVYTVEGDRATNGLDGRSGGVGEVKERISGKL